MPKIPRDLSGDKLAKLLKKYGYQIVRCTGSHIRLVSNLIKIGTLNNILADVAEYLEISKQNLIEELFGK